MTRIHSLLLICLIALLCAFALAADTVPARAQPSDSTAPALTSATVNGTSLVLTYDEVLDPDSVPDTSAYSVTVGDDAAVAPSSVAIDDSSVELTLSAAVTAADSVKLSYAVPSSDPVQDVSGNPAAALDAEPVVNGTPMISNLGQGNSSIRSANQAISQMFTTGCHPDGYRLSNVRMKLRTKGDDYTAAIYSTQFDGTPGEFTKIVHTLNLPADKSSDVLTFAASENAKLEPNARYSFVLFTSNHESQGYFRYRVTLSDDEDPGRAAGWRMANEHHVLMGSSDWFPDWERRVVQIAVEATPIAADEVTGANDETSTSSTDLVSNLGQHANTFDANPVPRSQIFKTGCHAAGYNLSSIQMKIHIQDRDATVGIHATEDDGTPGELLYPLTLPDDLSSLTKTFVAPDGATLEPRTRYSVLIDPKPGKRRYYTHFHGTISDDEDPGKADAWSIDDFYLVVDRRYWTNAPHEWRQDHHYSSGRLAVNGTPIDIEATDNNAATGQPSITGTARVGETVSVSTVDIADADGNSKAEDGDDGYAYNYRWIRVDGSTETNIADATSNTYTLTSDDDGKQIKVEVSFTDDLDNAESATSDRWPSDGSIVTTSMEIALTLSADSLAEDDGATSITVTGSLDAAPRNMDTEVTVTVGETNDTATEGTDYATVDDLTLTIPAGQTSGTASFTLTPIDDDVDETDETLSVDGATSVTDLAVSETMVTIVDDDERGVTVSATDLTVPEDGTATYTVVLESEPTATVMVAPSASGDEDVTLSPSSLSFTAANWDTPQAITVSAARDDDTEDDSATISHTISGGDYALETASDVAVTVVDDGVTVVPSDWPLIPSERGPGDEFRLLAKTKNPLKPDATSSTDIADYNDYVKHQIKRRGHRAVRDYADAFRVLGSTSIVNARDNTGTTGTGGVPIYWLNGAKVAYDYDDFYDGSWSNKYTGRGVAGDLIMGNRASGRQLLCTGTADDGTTTDLPLGGGDPDGNGTYECTSTSIAIRSNTLSGGTLDVAGRARYLALSNVFRVAEANNE